MRAKKILSILLCILKRSAQNNAWTSAWVNQKGYITFSYEVMQAKKILSILLCILKRSAQNNVWTSAWVNQKGYHQGETSLTLFFIIHFAKPYPIRSKYPEALKHKIMPAWTSTWMNQKGYKKYKLSALRMMLSPRIVFISSTGSSWSGALEADVNASVTTFRYVRQIS